jgi:hypothetical protein
MTVFSIIFYFATHMGDILGLLHQFLDLIHGMPKDQADAVKAEFSQNMHSGNHEANKQLVKSLCNGSGMQCEAFKGP